MPLSLPPSSAIIPTLLWWVKEVAKLSIVVPPVPPPPPPFKPTHSLAAVYLWTCRVPAARVAAAD